MKQTLKDTIRIRAVSTAFVAVTLAVFKPFGLAAWQWEAYVHLFVIFVLGVILCLLIDLVMNYVWRVPPDDSTDVRSIFRRNLYFQLINIPLVSLMICLYRHFVLSDKVEGNLLSWSNYLETMLIIAFCSFLIGLYWRLRFRSQYMAAELEETRQLNEHLQESQRLSRSGQASASSSSKSSADGSSVTDMSNLLTLTGSTNESVTLDIHNLLYVEAVGNYMKVCSYDGGNVRTDTLRATSKQVEDELSQYPMIVRCHRAFLVNLEQVERIVSDFGSMQLLIRYTNDTIPVSRSHVSQIRNAIKSR